MTLLFWNDDVEPSSGDGRNLEIRLIKQLAPHVTTLALAFQGSLLRS